jgi:hypothetical protein
MKKVMLALIIMLMLTACAPQSTPEPTPTPTDIPTLDDVYSDFIALYNELFLKASTNKGMQDKIEPLDLYFFEQGGTQSLVANVQAIASEQNSMTPLAYPIAVISKIIGENMVSYPRDLDTLVINEVDDHSGKKYKVHTAVWSDFIDYSVGKITLEQLFARMEHEDGSK